MSFSHSLLHPDLQKSHESPSSPKRKRPKLLRQLSLRNTQSPQKDLTKDIFELSQVHLKCKPQILSPEISALYQKINRFVEGAEKKVQGLLKNQKFELKYVYKHYFNQIKSEIRELTVKTIEQEKRFNENDRIQSLERENNFLRAESLRYWQENQGLKSEIESLKLTVEGLHQDNRQNESILKRYMRYLKVLNLAEENPYYNLVKIKEQDAFDIGISQGRAKNQHPSKTVNQTDIEDDEIKFCSKHQLNEMQILEMYKNEYQRLSEGADDADEKASTKRQNEGGSAFGSDSQPKFQTLPQLSEQKDHHLSLNIKSDKPIRVRLQTCSSLLEGLEQPKQPSPIQERKASRPKVKAQTQETGQSKVSGKLDKTTISELANVFLTCIQTVKKNILSRQLRKPLSKSRKHERTQSYCKVVNSLRFATDIEEFKLFDKQELLQNFIFDQKAIRIFYEALQGNSKPSFMHSKGAKAQGAATLNQSVPESLQVNDSVQKGRKYSQPENQSTISDCQRISHNRSQRENGLMTLQSAEETAVTDHFRSLYHEGASSTFVVNHKNSRKIYSKKHSRRESNFPKRPHLSVSYQR